jgi:osmotically inducible protein OsmC
MGAAAAGGFTMQRTATAIWRGAIKDGEGKLSTSSGVLKETPYSFRSRFENAPQTNPEELIAAAHAGCFAMATSKILGDAGHPPEQLDAKADLTLEQVDGSWTITKVHLTLTGRVPGMDAAAFREAAEKAKANCPVSRLLKADITLDAKLAG